MALDNIHHVTIIGVGLLGGSAGLAIKACDPKVKIAGVGRRRESLERALEIGAIDSAHLDAKEAAGQSDLVILSTPVSHFEMYMHQIKGLLRKNAIVTDVGSTKAVVVRSAEKIFGNGGQFVGSHPMAGSEMRGAAAARADLFAGATCIVTPTSKTQPRLVKKVELFWQGLGMRTVRMTPAAHDKAVSRISHLPHALAALLMMLPTDGELEVAASGFRDATRLASGDVEMWRDIFITNRKQILDSLEKFGKSMAQLRSLLNNADSKKLEKFFTAARERRSQTILRDLHDRRMSVE